MNDDDDVTAYTGIKNVPDITSKTADVTVAVVNDGAYADVVYIYSADMSISGDSATVSTSWRRAPTPALTRMTTSTMSTTPS